MSAWRWLHSEPPVSASDAQAKCQGGLNRLVHAMDHSEVTSGDVTAFLSGVQTLLSVVARDYPDADDRTGVTSRYLADKVR